MPVTPKRTSEAMSPMASSKPGYGISRPGSASFAQNPNSDPHGRSRPGNINGQNIEYKCKYSWYIQDLLPGQYDAMVGIYSHRSAGKQGRDLVRSRNFRLVVI